MVVKKSRTSQRSKLYIIQFKCLWFKDTVTIFKFLWISELFSNRRFRRDKAQNVNSLFWLITIGSEFYFSEVKLDESYRWRHQSRLQRSQAKSQKILDLKNGWRFLILDYESGNLSSILVRILSPFLQNVIRRSGNSP